MPLCSNNLLFLKSKTLKNMKLRLIGIFLCLLLVSGASAKIEVRSKQITMADGLANSTVRHFIQDSKGFIWMGTFKDQKSVV